MSGSGYWIGSWRDQSRPVGIGDGLPAWPQSERSNNGTYLWFAEHSTGATSGSPYFGTSTERRNALFHDARAQIWEGVDSMSR